MILKVKKINVNEYKSSRDISNDYQFIEMENELYIKKYKGNDIFVIIPDEVNNKKIVSILPDSFANSNIVEIELSNNISIIGDSAFENCKFLKKVILSEHISEIDENAFKNCINLVEVIGLNDDIYIASNAFSKCNKINYKTKKYIRDIIFNTSLL